MDQIQEIKSTPEGDVIIKGYGVVFGGKDLVGDTFTKDTDYMMDLVPTKLVLYDHTKQSVLGDPIGFVPKESIKIDDTGVFIEMQIGRHVRYKDAIAALAKAGVLGISSGAVSHLVRREDGLIKRWPLVEFSPTPTPAEPRTLAYTVLKSLAEHSEELKAIIGDMPNDEEDTTPSQENSGVEASGQETTDPSQKNITTITKQGATKMSEETTQNNQSVVDAMKAFMTEWRAEVVEKPLKEVNNRVDQLSTNIDKVLNAIQTIPQIKNSGFFTQDGGKKDPEIKNFADFLLAIKRRDNARLYHVYGATKDLSGEGGSSGGYLVPHMYSAELLKMSEFNSPVTSRVRKIPVTSDSGRWPVLDQYLTPGAGTGQTAIAAGVVTTATPPGASLTKTEPSFEMLEWRLHKTGGYTEVDNELIEDSPQSIEALLRGLFGIAIQAKTERNILRGSGVGEPLGILNSASAIGVSPASNNLFSWPDVGNMWSRFKSVGGTPVWLIHPGIWPDILTMELGTGGAGAWTMNMQGGAGQNINGFQILTSEHMPQDDYAGGVLLADLGAYLLFGNESLSIAYSEHAAFVSDQGTWRFTQRIDGMPWLRNPITLADPQGSYTVSPFVYHND